MPERLRIIRVQSWGVRGPRPSDATPTQIFIGLQCCVLQQLYKAGRFENTRLLRKTSKNLMKVVPTKDNKYKVCSWYYSVDLIF